MYFNLEVRRKIKQILDRVAILTESSFFLNNVMRMHLRHKECEE